MKTLRLIACGATYELGTALLKLSKALQVKPAVAFRSNAQHDATFSEGEHYSGTRATFLP